MIEEIARWIAILDAVWLIAVGVIMLARPHVALRALAKMGSTNVIHYTELSLRLLGGVGLTIAAAASRFPAALTPIGWFIIVSSIVLLLLPRRWHASYSTWWAKRISPLAVRLVAPLSVAVGGALIYSVA